MCKKRRDFYIASLRFFVYSYYAVFFVFYELCAKNEGQLPHFLYCIAQIAQFFRANFYALRQDLL